jgi:hypothetical protein
MIIAPAAARAWRAMVDRRRGGSADRRIARILRLLIERIEVRPTASP